MIGADCVAKTLEHLGVKFTFGLPESDLPELANSLTESKIMNVGLTSQLSASFMADGYARATGDVGVLISIPGPSLTNMISGLAEALLDSSSVLVMVFTREGKLDPFQIPETEQNRVLEPVVKTIFSVHHGIEIPKTVMTAFQTAQKGEPGPVLIEIPYHLLKEKTDCALDPIADEKGTDDTEHNKIERIADILRKAKQPAIYAGKGAFDASEQLLEIAEHLSMPVATTISGKGVFPEDHRLCLGYGFGPSGTKEAEKIFTECDVVLAIGCKFSEMSSGYWSMEAPRDLIHIDSSNDVFNRNYAASITLCMDAKEAASQILERIRTTKKQLHTRLLSQIEKEKYKRVRKIKNKRSVQAVHPTRFLFELRNTLPRDSIVVTDCGNHQLFTITDFRVFEPRSFFSPSDYQSMGFGVPAAIGAAIGKPEKTVLCICGDAGFLITGFELLTAVRERLNVKIVIFNDESLGLIKSMQNRFHGRTSSVDFKGPSFADMAKALGVAYVDIQTENEIHEGLTRMEASPDPVIVNVQVDYGEWPDYMNGVVMSAFKKMPLSDKMNAVAKRADRLLRYGR